MGSTAHGEVFLTSAASDEELCHGLVASDDPGPADVHDIPLEYPASDGGRPCSTSGSKGSRRAEAAVSLVGLTSGPLPTGSTAPGAVFPSTPTAPGAVPTSMGSTAPGEVFLTSADSDDPDEARLPAQESHAARLTATAVDPCFAAGCPCSHAGSPLVASPGSRWSGSRRGLTRLLVQESPAARLTATTEDPCFAAGCPCSNTGSPLVATPLAAFNADDFYFSHAWAVARYDAMRLPSGAGTTPMVSGDGTTIHTYLDDVYIATGPGYGFPAYAADMPRLAYNDDMPHLVDVPVDFEMPYLVDVTPVDFEHDMTWFRWLADADAWLGGAYSITAITWLGHIAALWDSPERSAVANMVLASLSHTISAQARCPLPVLRFIEASYWADPRQDGQLRLFAAYRGASDLTTHAILTECAAISK